MILLLGLIFGLLLCWFALWCIGAAWRLTEALAQGIAGGVRLFWALTHAVIHGAWRAARYLQRNAFLLDMCMSQHAHALWYSYSYWAQRRFIASQLRQRRKEKHS